MSTEDHTLAENIFSEGQLAGSFSGWGKQRVLALSVSERKICVIADTNEKDITSTTVEKVHKPHAKLSVIESVSIAGCDLLGSCLYTAGVCAKSGGKLAPVGLFLVTVMLYYFRLVYSEVVSALPVNGGTYNLLLNTSTKKVAAFVACLSLLSYTATAIVSAFDAVLYLALLWPEVDVRGFTVLIIGVFTCITLCGVKESSTVTLFLFSIHTLTIAVLVIWGFVYGCQDGFSIFSDNMFSHLPEIVSSEGTVLGHRNPGLSIFLGYSSALLGITGFETASNYVEDLESPQTFISSVNWMWVLVGLFNPIISIVSMMVLPMETIYEHPSDMLAVMADQMGGTVFRNLLCVDAVMVLCGGVLTAIVGVTGLIDRLAKDKVVPEAMASLSPWGSSYVAIICFSIFSITLFLCIFDPTDPTGIDRFGGVFAISFLSVLAAFAFAAIMLKLYRPNLARLVVTKWWQVILSFVAVLLGFVGNIILTPDVFVWFVIYLFILVAVVAYMFVRVDVLSAAIWMLRKIHLSSSSGKHKKNISSNSHYNSQHSDRKDAEIIAAYNQQSAFEEFDEIFNAEQDDYILTPCKPKSNSKALPIDRYQDGTHTAGGLYNGYDDSENNNGSSRSYHSVDSYDDLDSHVVHSSDINNNCNNIDNNDVIVLMSTNMAVTANQCTSTDALQPDNCNDPSSINTNVPAEREFPSLAAFSTDGYSTPPQKKKASHFSAAAADVVADKESTAESKGAGNSHATTTVTPDSLLTINTFTASNPATTSTTASGLLMRTPPRRGRKTYFDDEEFQSNHPVRGKLLTYCMDSLDSIVGQPFVYFAKRPDPISLHTAMEYIAKNEQSDVIYVIHFVDDRDTCREMIRTLNKQIELKRDSVDGLGVEAQTAVGKRNIVSGTPIIASFIRICRWETIALTAEGQK